MTQPTQQQMDEASQFPTTLPGLAFSLIKVFGAWALIAIATAVLWMQYKETNAELLTMLKSNIMASAASTKAVEGLANEIKQDRMDSQRNLASMESSVGNLLESVRENRTMLKDNGTVVRENTAILHEIRAATNKAQSSQ